MARIRVLVFCCSGAATSTVVMEGVEAAAKKAGFDVDVWSTGMYEFQQSAEQADLVVSTGAMPKMSNTNKPVLTGLCYLTGIGIEAFEEQLIETLRQIQSSKGA
ncbi:MAG TPA: hypothetical protein ENI37_00105 [Chloroflexi bacterium]|nr:hypothetical protein [Chloroflexota bacterium]